MKIMKNLMALLLVLALTACATATKVDSGEHSVGGRLQLVLEEAWNQINAPGLNGPNCQTWTMEGMAIDQLLIYTGLKDDEALHCGSGFSDKKSFKFRAGMQPDQIVALFEGMLTRDGSTFLLLRLEPAPFGGGKGFHFEYSLTRKSDNVELLGTADAVVSGKELYAIVYQAPKLVFYPRHQKRVAHIIKSARLAGEV